MKPVVLIMLLLAVAALSCNKKDTPPANKPNSYKYKVRLAGTFATSGTQPGHIMRRQYSYNKEGYLSAYRYVDSTIGGIANDVTEIAYIRGFDNQVLMELYTYANGTKHMMGKYHYDSEGNLIEVQSYQDNSLRNTTKYKWENGKITAVYLDEQYFTFAYNGIGNIIKLTQFENDNKQTNNWADQTEFDSHVNVWTMIPGMENPFAVFGPYPEYYSTNNITHYRTIGSVGSMGRYGNHQYEYNSDGFVSKENGVYTTVFIYENAE